MSEQQEKQESQKTLVAFVAGLLIGGLLVWVFGGSPKGDVTPDETDDQTTEEVTDATDTSADDSTDSTSTETDSTPAKPVLQTGEGKVTVADQAAGSVVKLDKATFPTDEGWVAVRSYPNGQLGSILGAARYSKEQGLVPEEVQLLAPTISGREYAVVFFSEDGDRVFNLATDVQIEGSVGTFTAN